MSDTAAAEVRLADAGYFTDHKGNQYKVSIVDGEKVRANIDIDFLDFAEHQHKPYVPADEIWVDDSIEAEEVVFMVRAAARESLLMQSGDTYRTATTEVQREGALDRQSTDKSDADVLLEAWPDWSQDAITVYVVDGDAVRSLFSEDFVFGGHWMMYPFIPKDEIWIEDTLAVEEAEFILLHEITECNLMVDGMDYPLAHKKANANELLARTPNNQYDVKVMLAEQFEIANSRVTKMSASSFNELIAKESPSLSDVHVSTALGNEHDKKKKKKKGQTFNAFVTGGANQSESPVHGTVIPANKRKPLAFGFEDALRRGAEFKPEVAKANPLRMRSDGMAHTPFPHDVSGLANLRPDQVPRFLSALTDQNSQEDKDVRIGSLTAMQDRVDPETVASMQDKEPTKKPLVVRANGRNYIADGHHRLAAKHLNGDKMASVKYADLSAMDTAVKSSRNSEQARVQEIHDHAKAMGAKCSMSKSTIDPSDTVIQLARTALEEDGPDWHVPLEIKKMDEDRQMVFGWASVVEKAGKLIIDKQGDYILPADLEDAVYDFVLYERAHGDMHERSDTGGCIESMMFTKQKQEALGIDLGMQGWWVGFHVTDDDLWAAHKRGERPEFSIGGTGRRTEDDGA